MARSISSFSSTCKVKVTERRAAKDYAQCMRELVDIHYPGAEIIRVVQDNLSTHSAGGSIRRSRLPKPDGSVEFHYTPKRASWLNMVETRSASCGDSASIAESTTPSDCAARSPLGNDRGMPHAPASNGCSLKGPRLPKGKKCPRRRDRAAVMIDKIAISSEPCATGFRRLLIIAVIVLY